MRSRADVDRDWNADDVIAAHRMLDAFEEAEAKALREAERRAQRARGR